MRGVIFMKKKKHIKRNLLVGLAGAALVAAIVYDKMNKNKVVEANDEDEVIADKEEIIEEEQFLIKKRVQN